MKYLSHTSLLFILLTLAACGKNKDSASSGPDAVEVAYPVVDSVTLHRSYPATVYSNDAAEVVARVDGVILSCNYKGGERVAAGQVLFTIESSKYRDAVAQAESALSTARAEYAYASKQYEALKKALSSDAVSQMDVIQAKSSMEQGASAIKNATAALQTARTNLGYCQVRAPIAGIVSTPAVDVGNFVGGGASPVVLCTVYDDQLMSVHFNIEDSEYQKILGANGGIRNPLFRRVPISFTNPLPHDYAIDLSYESPSVDTSTGSLLIKGLVRNEDDELKDGMYCTVSLPYGIDPRAILVKDASIGTDQLGKYVYTVNDSNIVACTHIQVGDIFRDSLRVVTKGLTPRQRYVTKALLNVRQGEKIRPVLAK